MLVACLLANEGGDLTDLLVKIGGFCSRRSMLRQAYPRLGMGRGVGVQRRAVSSTSLPGISAASTSQHNKLGGYLTKKTRSTTGESFPALNMLHMFLMCTLAASSTA